MDWTLWKDEAVGESSRQTLDMDESVSPHAHVWEARSIETNMIGTEVSANGVQLYDL